MTHPRRIGVLTFHRCINYGSYWQARCLVEGVRARGFDAVLLDHDSRRVNLAEWRCALMPHRPLPTRRDDRAAYARKTRSFFAAFDLLPLSRRFRLEYPEGLEDYDLVLVGSDEVWNRRHPWYGAYGLFYGSGVERRMAAYAASFGNQPAAEGLDPGLAGLLRRFEAISVRDDNSLRLIREGLGCEPDLVLDPCLLFPEIARRPGGAETVDVVVYGHGFPEWFQRGVRGWARSRGIRVLSLGYRNDWADAQWLDAGPEDFTRCIAGAAAVATTFFHGCVFALLHGRPFVCTVSDYRANKIASLVSLLGAEERLVDATTSADGYGCALETPPGAATLARIAALRVSSEAYLDHVLG